MVSKAALRLSKTSGGMVGLCSVEPGPDGKWTVTQIPCHADQVTDLDFSPFDDNLLATCSADETVKVWRVFEPGQEQPVSANASLSPGEGRLELVLFHPAAAGLLAVGSSRGVQVWDTSRDKALAVLEQHMEQLHSLAWKEDGSLLASTCKIPYYHKSPSITNHSCHSSPPTPPCLHSFLHFSNTLSRNYLNSSTICPACALFHMSPPPCRLWSVSSLYLTSFVEKA
ncbi:coronin-7 [Silurus meridionalis]|nr:coronin-7 [Silurus meridionalis]